MVAGLRAGHQGLTVLHMVANEIAGDERQEVKGCWPAGTMINSDCGARSKKQVETA